MKFREFLIIAAAVIVLGLVGLRLFGDWLLAPEAPAPAATAPSTAPPASGDLSASERKLHEDINRALRERCIAANLATAAQQGRSGPSVEEEMTRRCDCVAELVEPMSMDEKIALGSDPNKQRALMAEVQRRCLR